MQNELRQVGTSYGRLVEQGLIKPERHTVKVRAAGTSNAVFEESSAIDIQPDVYFPVAPTPPELAIMRRDLRPGVISAPRGPVPDIIHGVAGDKSDSVAKSFKAGQKSNIQEYIEDFAERNYSTVKREPLGKPVDRGYDMPKDLVFGNSANPNGAPLTAKEVIFPRGVEDDTGDMHKRYVKTHRDYQPGEQVDREYLWPAGVNPAQFKFGREENRTSGTTRDALTWDQAKQPTKIVLKRLEDYRAVSRDLLGEKKNYMQYPLPVPADFRFGARSSDSSNTAASCLHFNSKVVVEVMPEKDLGKCDVQGKRNILSDRVYGLPSIRTDIPRPDIQSRSVANVNNYGDDLGTASLLHPQRFENMGVPDEQFLDARSKADMQTLLNGANINVDERTFEKVWSACKGESVSIKDFLNAYGRVVVDVEVAQRFGAII
jgi:EF-hand domain-containing family member B